MNTLAIYRTLARGLNLDRLPQVQRRVLSAFGASILGATLLVSCAISKEERTTLGPPPDLEPNDRRPHHSVRVEDADEAALLVQELDIEPVRLESGELVFIGDEAVLKRLHEFGYRPGRLSVHEVYRRVVRVAGGEEAGLERHGLRLINRESDYFVAEGPLSAIRGIVEAGWQVARVVEGEPRPRPVRFVVRDRHEIAGVGQLNVDIYDVDEVKGGYLIQAGAFDAQIDKLEARGYQVERLPLPAAP